MRRTRRPLIALVALLALLVIGYVARTVQDDSRGSGHTSGSSQASGAHVPLSSLPVQARQTVALIRAGGPFPYSQDGGVFRNAEGLLPKEKSGYYHEYTVTTPGSADRGARRIITGSAGEYYYTSDHYESFRRVDVNR
ncbi:MAG: ribonuclease domain-containing protein [Jatrophihabitans sp.]